MSVISLSANANASVGVASGNLSGNTIEGNLSNLHNNCNFSCCSDTTVVLVREEEAAAAPEETFQPIASSPFISLNAQANAASGNGSGNTVQDNLNNNQGNFVFNCCSGRSKVAKKAVKVVAQGAAAGAAAQLVTAVGASAAAGAAAPLVQVNLNATVASHNGSDNAVKGNGNKNRANCIFVCCTDRLTL